jgi:hypothetical protein
VSSLRLEILTQRALIFTRRSQRGYGARANYGLSDALKDTGIGGLKWGYNSFAGISNLSWAIAARATWEYIATGIPRDVPYSGYYEYSNQTQANAGTALTIASFLAPTFLKAKPAPISFAGFTIRTTSETEAGLGEAAATNIFRRPSNFRKGVDSDVWDNAASGPNGGKLCSTCGKEIFWKPGEPRFNNWHIDHFDPKWYQRRFDGMTRKQVLDDYNNIEKLRLRCAPCNVADNHQHEDQNDINRTFGVLFRGNK